MGLTPTTLVPLLLFVTLASCTPAFLDLCPLDINSTIARGSNITWGQASARPIQKFDGSSYLRPDIGGALLPWVYTILILVVHIPVVIIRVVRWEVVQNWCLAGTLLSVVITAQGYASTGFQPKMILTWTPLLLIIDAGSMAQVLFLINEDANLLPRLLYFFKHGIDPAASSPPSSLLADAQTGLLPTDEKPSPAFTPPRCASPSTNPSSPPENPSPPLFTSPPLYTALTALLLLLTILLLQLLALLHAAPARHLPPPLVSWCSPIFQPFGVAVLDGACSLWPIAQTFSKGVGCISIPGQQQAAWLSATVGGTALSMMLEAVDVGVLMCVGSGARWRGVKMRRPWGTMVGGVVGVGLVLVFGVVYASTLPPGVADRVWVVTQVASEVVVYEGELGTAGLRGAMIGWNDGVFQGWGSGYFGSWDGS